MLIKTLVVALYFAVILWAGLAGLRKTRSFADFFLGGGNIGPWMSAFTYATAYFSAVLFIGFAGSVGWNFGISGLWIAFGNALVGVLGVWMIMGRAIKKMSVAYDVQTMAEFFDKRYNSPGLKLFASIAIFVFFIPYTSAVFMGLSYLFRSNFGMDYGLALAIMGSVTAIYMILGGYRSMALVDVFFGMIMVCGVLVLTGFTLHKGGGMMNIIADLQAINPDLGAFVGPPGWWPLFCLVFLTSVAPFAMPQLVQKFYAIRDDRAIRIGTFASTIFALMISGVAYFIGSTTRLFLSPEATPGAFRDGLPIFDALMPELLANVVPASLSVLILLLVLSASMSTLAALVLISSSAMVKDFYAGFVRKDVSDLQLTVLMRYASFFFILLSVLLAYARPSSIIMILGISWGAIGSAFLGPFIWGLFYEKTTRLAAMVSGFGGLGTCLGLYFTGVSSSPEAGTIGMLTSLVLAPLVTLVSVRVADPGAASE
ncbi:SSS family solute:Na+ symporter/sodium/proline symporter [Desulfobotulus alkaliphilus]|uniref:SSS family solute:Na+ symporter/sodium/proline symporter n=1 Tax=Desulfobotulus alkaliphilus TaxID=622671 RepID=A0A562RIK4_9BACT|nr:sodium:solute symporter family protein [Desulfobotulus alkaliphilus]TWI68929.1 SSS family solute:Na+ symporter/sodium/proline symporter [Desulfobotulus alkaliphilus]